MLPVSEEGDKVHYLEFNLPPSLYTCLAETAQLVNDWSGHLWSCIQDMGFCFGYGFSHAVYLATFDSEHTFQYMTIHIIL